MRAGGFQHEVFFYADPDEFLAGTVPFLREALEASEPTLVAVTRERAESLRAELGSDGASIRYALMEEIGRNPARIVPFWRSFLDEDGYDRPVRGIGEPAWPGRSMDELDECGRHERLLNLAFAAETTWSLLCPYDSRGLDDEVLDAARRCHPHLARGGSSELNPAWSEDELHEAELFAGAFPARPAEAERLAFDRHLLQEVRELVAAAGEKMRLLPWRRSDLVTAASELAANSVRHGGGRGVVSVWPDDHSLVVEVEDAGLIEEPMVGRVQPLLAQDGGRGLWIANLLCDLVQIRSGHTGTTVRLRMRLA